MSTRILSLQIFFLFVISHASGNVVGTDAQNFNPITSGLDFLTVHSSETLKPGYINLGLFFNHAVNTLPYFDTGSAGDRGSFNDTLTGLDLNVGVGVLENWDVGLSLPQVLRQSVDDQTGPRGEFAATGNTEVRANSKYRLWGDDSGGGAILAALNMNRTQDFPYTGSDPGPTLNAELAWDTTIRRIAWGVNVGHRWRKPGTAIVGSPIRPFRNQFIFSTAASYLLNRIDTKVIAEIFGSVPTQKVDATTDRGQTSLEFLVGVKHDLTASLALHAGTGTELTQGAGSPDWRIYAGLNYAVAPFAGSQALPELRKMESAPRKTEERFITRNVNFEFGTANLDRDYAAVFAELVRYLNQPPGFRSLVIEGHTDSVGSEDYNTRLSQTRAQAIKDILVMKFKVETSKMQAVGFGESVPIADNGNFQGRRENRRVEFKIGRY